MRKIKYFLSSVLLVLLFNGCASSIQSAFYNAQADRNYINKNYKSALAEYKNAAETKNAYAYYRLYVMYNYGKGVRKDKEMADIMLQKAVDLGDDTAQVIMANRLLFGKYKNIRKAIMLLKLSAQKENKYAYSDLAMIYRYGYGAKKDLELSREYERLAKTNGIKISKTRMTKKKRRKGPSYSRKYLITQIQKGLSQLGFYRGKIDGIYGPMSRKAISMFQSFNSYPKDPAISTKLLKQIYNKLQ